MDQNLITYYRTLLDSGFHYSGYLDNPSVTLENFGEVSPVCGNPDDYMRLYIRVTDNVIDDIKYACITDPTTNVALEVLCALTKGKTIDEFADLTDEAFCRLVGSEDKGLREKARVLLDLVRTGILTHKAGS